MSQSHPYELLTPDRVLDAIESTGYLTDARILALNSYENRVYQVGIEGASPVIAKFYRPERWSDEQILEEHSFTAALKELEISVVPPLPDSDGPAAPWHGRARGRADRGSRRRRPGARLPARGPAPGSCG